jgi:hypothetical protein
VYVQEKCGFIHSSWPDFLLAEKLSMGLAAGHTFYWTSGLRQLELGAHWVMTASSFFLCSLLHGYIDARIKSSPRPS